MKVEAFYRKRKQLSQYLPPSERHKLKVERGTPRQLQTPAAVASANAAAASNPRTVVDNSLGESPVAPTGTTGTAGKRRPSYPDSEAEMSLSGDSTRLSGLDEVTNGEAQPPMKRSNTANDAPMNGNNGLEVS